MLLLLAPMSVFCQKTIFFSMGIGSYEMSDLKELQKAIQRSSVVGAHITESFPSYSFYEGSMKEVIGNGILLGGTVSYGSTGGRVSYGDYSGQFTSDQVLKFFSLSSVLGFEKKYRNETLIFQGDLGPGFTISRLNIKSNVTVGGYSAGQSDDFQSRNITIKPSLTLIKKFSFIGIHAIAGYHLTIAGGKLFDRSNNRIYLITGNGDPMHASWSGFRLSAGITVFLKELLK